MNDSILTTDGTVDDRVYTNLRRSKEADELLKKLQFEQTRISNITQGSRNNSLSNGLCGLPSFCISSPNTTCDDQPLKSCDNCNASAVYLLIALYAAMGFLVIFGNLLVIWNVARRRRGFGDTYSKVRASLAAADILTGIQIFAVVIYNLNWTLQSSLKQLDLKQLNSINSTPAVVGGVFYLLGFISSLYHLVYLAMQRLYAIALPIRYKTRSHKNSVYFSLTVVWSLAAISSTFPLWFPASLSFAYHHSIFLYFPTNVYASVTTADLIAIVSLVVLMVLPYLLMTGLSVATGVILYRYLQERVRKLTATHSTKVARNNVSTNEVRVFKTVTAMQIGFTISLLPLIIVTSMFHAGFFTCDDFPVPYQACFFLSMMNSLMNVLVYIVFDSKYRESILDMIRCDVFSKCKDSLPSNNNQKMLTSRNTRSSSLFKSVELKYIKQLTS